MYHVRMCIETYVCVYILLNFVMMFVFSCDSNGFTMMSDTSIQTCFLYTHNAMLKFLSLRKTTFLTNILSFSIMAEIKKNQKK